MTVFEITLALLEPKMANFGSNLLKNDYLVHKMANFEYNLALFRIENNQFWIWSVNGHAKKNQFWVAYFVNSYLS